MNVSSEGTQRSDGRPEPPPPPATSGEDTVRIDGKKPDRKHDKTTVVHGMQSCEFAFCVSCGRRNPIGDVICAGCSQPVLWRAIASEGRLFAPGDQLDDQCQILAQVAEYAGVETYIAKGLQPDSPYFLVRVARKTTAQFEESDVDDTSTGSVNRETVNCIVFGADRAIRCLRIERDILEDSPTSALPRFLESIETDQYMALVETLATGVPLLTAWKSGEFNPSRKCLWLEQLRQAFVHLHRRHCIAADMELQRLVVNADGQLQVRDLGGLTVVPSQGQIGRFASLYAGPELSSPDRIADYRADAFSFGCLTCALHLGRDLAPEDFVQPGQLRPLHVLLPDAAPPLFRLLSKTTCFHPDARFPSQGKQAMDPGGFGEIGEALSEYARAVHACRFEISGWSSTGLVREHNEDAFTISHLTTGALDFRRDVALVCVADGMGGHAAGEVASAIAVSTVAEYLRNRGLSSALTQRFGKNHPFHGVRRCAEILDEAIQEANQQVKSMADADSERTAMGCTLEAVLLVGRHAVISHVGDSRVYVISGNVIRQVTQDQTLVNRLVELGRLSPEQAAIHPRRAELSQAVGVHSRVAPARYFIDLKQDDWLIVCSDGLSNCVSPEQMVQILRGCSNSEQAARRLVNQANANGGADNATVVAVLVR